MKVFEDAWNRADLPSGSVATIGNYDGIHLGQQAILARVVDRSRELGVPASVVTFDPHPAKVLRPAQAPRCLATAGQKERLLAERGIDWLFVVRFDHDFAKTSATDFVETLLHQRLDLCEIYVGSRFVFGRGREGDLAVLQSLGKEIHPAWGVEEVICAHARISSTRIREAVATGHVEFAREMLGRPFELEGRVVHGAGKGHELGFPTLNLEHEHELIPAHGVYVTAVRIEGGAGENRRLQAVANVGVRPTVHVDSAPTVECHLLDFDGDLYGQAVSVGFLIRLRGEQAFASVAALQRQIALDTARARSHFESGTVPARGSVG